ncbi:MAG TPA: phospholipase D-like domain-containing protein [Candidatus Paceibacterota bacterium]|jgi:phosphatidylserine/phosphatidylglycerophosphate/cardiolipin synthase-like enzyme|nr:phospholipase D-like domain-containing protein [Candidatus Paceibacterota bacterium]
MQFKKAAAFGGGMVAVFASVALITARLTHTNEPAVALSACASCTLVTEPDDGTGPLLAMIGHAARSVDLVLYELSDTQMESALAAAAERGIAVRVLLNGGYKGVPDGTATINAGAFSFLQAHGVAVRTAPSYFDLTHEKTLVVDDAEALIMSFNLVLKYYATGRDFGVHDADATDVAEVEAAFNADWDGNNNFQPSASDPASNGDLVWSPGARPALLSLINGATSSLDIYNEEMSDPAVIAALEDVARRGVTVRIVMTYSPEWEYAFQELVASGAEVRTYNPTAALYIHAKVVVADDARAFVGSENFSAASLDDNRELGIIVSNNAAIDGLEETFAADWHGATSFGSP